MVYSSPKNLWYFTRNSIVLTFEMAECPMEEVVSASALVVGRRVWIGGGGGDASGPVFALGFLARVVHTWLFALGTATAGANFVPDFGGLQEVGELVVDGHLLDAAVEAGGVA